MRKCIICGTEFNPRNQHSWLCKKHQHYWKCQKCNKLIPFNSLNELGMHKVDIEAIDFKIKVQNDCSIIVEFPDKYCQNCKNEYYQTKEYKKIKQRKIEETFKKNHHGLSKKEYNQTEEGKKKLEERNERIDFVAAAERYRQTCLEKYGVDNYAKTEDFKNNTQPLINKNSHTPESNAKRRETMKEKYGVINNLLLPEIQAKALKAAQSPEAIAKKEKTMRKRYGVSNPYFLPGQAEKMIEAANKAYRSAHRSKVNKQLAEELRKLGIKVQQEYVLDNKNVVDFLCSNGNKQLLIDYNPVVTHNFDINYQKLVGMNDTDKPNRPKNYHLRRSRLAEEKGLELIQWFDHYDKEKLFDLIKSKLGMVNNIIGARKCKIVELDSKAAKDFINDNHLLGVFYKPQVNFGLEYDGEIISVMSFSLVKNNQSNQKLMQEDLSNSYELIRFCNKKDYSVTGGAKKLFKAFINKHQPDYVLTYSDYNLGNGNIYKQLEFVEKVSVKPSCFWTSIKKPKTFINNNLVLRGTDRFLPRYVENYFRVGTNEQDFVKRGGLEVYGKWPNNQDIMLHYGFVRVFDSGYKTWVWEK